MYNLGDLDDIECLLQWYINVESCYLNFHPLEVVSRYRDPQPQVDRNYYLFNLETKLS